MNTIILKGVHIGDNVIIGAGSIVNKDIPNNTVATGNPCKPIMTLDEYHTKRESAQLNEATELARLYRDRYGKDPDDKALHEFFWLFSDGNSSLTPKLSGNPFWYRNSKRFELRYQKRLLLTKWRSVMELMGNGEASYNALEKNIKTFESMDIFLQSIE